jgi:glucose-1-phosphate cytidylyltransferase
MKTLLLCGGRGVYDHESHVRIPKGMLMLGDRPILWHIMKTFSIYSYNDFVLALGDGGQYIRNFFLQYVSQLQDIELTISDGTIKTLNQLPEENWMVKFVDTGRNAHTGSRIARCRRYVENESFIISYSDCLCNVNIPELLAYHRKQGKIVTITGVQPPSRFGTFFTDNLQVTGYSSTTKLVTKGGFINGGFMIAEPSLFDYLTPYNECTLENEVFSQLAYEGQVAVFPHDGYWQAVDTERDMLVLNELYQVNKRPWLPDVPDLQTTT